MKKQLEEIMITVEQGEDALREMNYLLKRVSELHGIATKHYQDVMDKINENKDNAKDVTSKFIITDIENGINTNKVNIADFKFNIFSPFIFIISKFKPITSNYYLKRRKMN